MIFSLIFLGVMALLALLELFRRQMEPEKELRWQRRTVLALGLAVALLAVRAIGENSLRSRVARNEETIRGLQAMLQSPPKP